MESFFLVALICLVCFNFINKSIFVSIWFGLTIVLFSYEKGYISSILKNTFFQFLGKVSYSIYLVQGVILYVILSFILILEKVLKMDFTPKMDNQIFIDFGNVLINNIVFFITIIFVIIVSNYTNKHIEVVGVQLGRKLINKE